MKYDILKSLNYESVTTEEFVILCLFQLCNGRDSQNRNTVK